jgi:hypothetical protein
MIFKFNLGDELKDFITGYKGIVRCRAEYLTGCNRYALQSQKLDKEKEIPQEWLWFDENELILVKEGKIVIEEYRVKNISKGDNSKDNGGPRPSSQNPPK